MLDVVVAVVALPGLSLGGGRVGDENGLVRSVAHGDCDGGVVEEEAIARPGGRGLCDPVVPAVEEVLMEEVEVEDAKVDVTRGLAMPVAGHECENENEHESRWGRKE